MSLQCQTICGPRMSPLNLEFTKPIKKALFSKITAKHLQSHSYIGLTGIFVCNCRLTESILMFSKEVQSANVNLRLNNLPLPKPSQLSLALQLQLHCFVSNSKGEQWQFCCICCFLFLLEMGSAIVSVELLQCKVQCCILFCSEKMEIRITLYTKFILARAREVGRTKKQKYLR